MKRILVFLMVLALCLTGCEKPLVPAATGVQAVPTTVPETTVPSLVDAKNGGDTVLEAVLNGEVEKE